MKKFLPLAAFALLSVFFFNSCATLNSLAGLTRAEFKLQDAIGYRLSGIDITNKRSINDFSVMDGLNLVNAFRTGKFPLTFTLNVAVRNPNQHQSGSNLSALSLTSFPWRLLIDNKETITGNIGNSVSLPDGGTTTIIPLQVSVDLKQFFAEKGYDDIVGLALAVAGQGSSKLALKAQPTVSTPIGSLKYPNELTIVNTEFRN
ncbi:MAG: hypothetical protein Q8916_07815 [Bacteroidota bacterium]|nr:hypothetical protein [Bacteroidota bacterium]MDP4230293.1 hypothetical protein [Bacteroidota bacterium]MDP4235620.1 hypothetical protein [Bacteroidota bacterium]